LLGDRQAATDVNLVIAIPTAILALRLLKNVRLGQDPAS
jgi:hypothetical protein